MIGRGVPMRLLRPQCAQRPTRAGHARSAPARSLFHDSAGYQPLLSGAGEYPTDAPRKRLLVGLFSGLGLVMGSVLGAPSGIIGCIPGRWWG